MRRYVTIQKHIGETPRVALERFRTEADIAPEIPLAYAGRLDPLASGTLLVLIGNECKRQRDYHRLDKAYEFEILCGISTDTGDVLGFPTLGTPGSTIAPRTIRTALYSFLGTHTFHYPHFSSKTVRGTPLFQWTLEGKLDQITIPTLTSRIHQLTLLDTRTLTTSALETQIAEKINSIPPVTDAHKAFGNDFRRPEIRAAWLHLFANISPTTSFTLLRCRTIVSSGTYIRTLAPAIAESLGTTGLAFSIHRTTIGRYLPLIPHTFPFGPQGIWLSRLA